MNNLKSLNILRSEEREVALSIFLVLLFPNESHPLMASQTIKLSLS
jgi:hypothetical protein